MHILKAKPREWSRKPVDPRKCRIFAGEAKKVSRTMNDACRQTVE